jgi:uncharacterized protein involved in response to NO
VRRDAIVWYFVAFGLLLASGVLIAVAARSFLSSLSPLHAAIALSVGAIACAMVALARQVGE